MKKLLTLCLLTVAISDASAQTKEETINFIAKYMREAEGLKTYSPDDTTRLSESLYRQNAFSADKIYMELEREDYEKGTYIQTREITNLTWENVENIVLDTIPSLFHEDDIATISLGFSTKIKETEFCQSGTYNISCDNSYYWNGFTIVIPRNRGSACKKALQHLVSLYKEENKDPFAK
jgi:hypothetical protein